MSAKRRLRDDLPKGWELDWDQLPVETLPSVLVTVRIECGDLVMESGLPATVGA